MMKTSNREYVIVNAKYQTISKEIRDNVRLGVWPPGYRLPTRCELVKEYGTTVATLQKAMDELLNDGFIISAGKSGTFVAENPPNLSTFAVVFPAAPDAASSWDTFWTLFASQKRQFEEQFKLEFRFYYLGSENAECTDFKRLVADACEQRIAGVIFPHPPCDYMTAPLLAAGVQCVAVTRDELPGVNTVWVDYGDFLRQAFDLMIGEGARRVAVITNARLPFDYITALADYATLRGFALPPEWRLGLALESHVECWGPNLVRLLMKSPPGVRPDGLIIANENLRDIVVDTLQELELRIGRDVSVVQHANFPSGQRLLPGVSRIGFEVRTLVAGCLEELRRARRTGVAAHNVLIPAVREAELGG